MPEQTILVTGATGTMGGAVARQLAGTGTRVRALVRDPDTATLPEGVTTVQGDLSKPGGLEPALVGVDAVFLMWPFLRSAGAGDVLDVIARHARRVVYLSAKGARPDVVDDDNPILRFHGELETAVERSGLEWVMLRPASFASNTLGWGPQFRTGVVRAPFASQPRAMVHEADVAAVAVRALLDDDLVGTRPVLTGPESLTTAEQVSVIAEQLGVAVRYEEIATEVAASNARAAGIPDDLVNALFSTDREFEPQDTTSDVEAITGRRSRSLRDWARDHAEVFVG
ncbi:NmrA family NAD(P)-binding protein [Solicola gregarius]|uniref:NAD(P)H-binding protein n=1 Tax=Solicola gregarius TaxID=2908642 RepID=A0AA46YIZ6_9ACTN|nr:NAD(P)H-binding protein [Solicola gregarius]UYM03840.1 NAD(P)H-binding protein [Solicola gregarius]